MGRACKDFDIDSLMVSRDFFRRELDQCCDDLSNLGYDEKRDLSLWNMKKHPQMSRLNLEVNQDVVNILQRKADLEETLRVIDRLLDGCRGVVAESKSETGEIDTEIEVYENVLDVGGQDTFKFSAGRSIAPSIGQDELLTIDNFMMRPVHIDGFELKLSTDLNASYKIWDLLSLEPSVRAKFRNYAYFRGNIKVRVALSGTPFHMGRILVAYYPYPLNIDILQALLTASSIGAGTRYLLLSYLSQSPGAFTMDVRANKPVDFEIPFISTKPMFRLFNVTNAAIAGATSLDDFANAGTLYIYSLNQITATTASPTNVAFNIYAHFENVQLGTVTATQLAIITEGKDERKTGPVEKFATTAATVSDALTAVPEIAVLAKASSYVFSGLASIASWFGWSKPIIIERPIFVKNRPFSNSAHTIGSDTVEKISWDPQQELTIDPRVVGIEVDELALSNLYSIESLIATFTWGPGNQPLASPMWKSLVTPTLGAIYVESPGPRTVIQPTPMCFVAQWFTYWRGTIRFRFEIVCSAFHRGKFAVYFEPNPNQASIMDAKVFMNKQFLKIIDIQETSSVEFCVHWAQPRAWCQVQSAADVANNFSSGTSGFSGSNINGYCNGYIAIVPFNQLQSPDGSGVSVNVYAKGENLQFNYFSALNAPLRRDTIVQSADISTDLLDNSITCYDLNLSTSEPKNTSDFQFGEQPLSFRSALRRYVSNISYNGTSAGTQNCILLTALAIRSGAPAVGSALGSTPTLWQYLPLAFLGVRGGVKKRLNFMLPSGVTDGYSNPTIISVNQIGSPASVTEGITFGSNPTSVPSRGSVMFVNHTNGGIEFEIPYYSGNLFQFSSTNNFVGTNATDEMMTSWLCSYVAAYNAQVANGSVCYVIESQAAGEDFMFMRFLGAPYYTV